MQLIRQPQITTDSGRKEPSPKAGHKPRAGGEARRDHWVRTHAVRESRSSTFSTSYYRVRMTDKESSPKIDFPTVIPFPDKAGRDWAVLERAIIKECSTRRFSAQAQERLVTAMKAFYDLLDPDLNFTITATFPGYMREEDCIAIQEAIGHDISRQNSEILQRFTNQLYVERFAREVQFLNDMGLLT